MQGGDASKTRSEKSSQGIQAPSISLPKGGGAIHGIGEKFSANPVTGTGSMSVPIALSPGRAGFGPQLALSYDSGAGNGLFGLGWNLGLPSITRKTDKGLPQYCDEEESDVFIIAGAEDLVRKLDASGHRLPPQQFTINNVPYKVFTYCPRIEGAFALIERWLDLTNSGNTFWRTISRDNITTWFGHIGDSRITDPENPAHTFQWLICQSHDDKGNVIEYLYDADKDADIEKSALWEINRSASQRIATRYPNRIRYGNLKPYLPTLSISNAWPSPSSVADQAWMFEVVFDYSDANDAATTVAAALIAKPKLRTDPFSSYRAGFEERTYRLCKRVLMFHHFPDELAEADTLVRSTEFDYDEHSLTQLKQASHPGYTTLRSVTHRAYERNTDLPNKPYEFRDFPPVTYSYSKPTVDQTVRSIAAEQLMNLPVGTQGPGYQWIDLDGEGLSGVLSEQTGAWYYKPNRGDGSFGEMRVVARQPAMALQVGGRHQFMDLAGNGQIDVVDFDGTAPGFYERDLDEGWKRHVPFASLPNIDWQDANLRFLDLTGDGHADALVTEHDVFTWYRSLDEKGFAASVQTRHAIDENLGPHIVFADGSQSVFLADMCGDGLTDLVRIRNGEICYWPNLGYGRFGRKITLGNSPRFDVSDMFDPRRIRLSDIDGSGPIDIIYLGRSGAQIYFNRSGNSLSDAFTVNLPIATENLGSVQVADLLGNGTACLVWNSHLPAEAGRVRYIDLMGGATESVEQHRKHEKPHLLIKVNNNLGGSTEIEYTPSTRFYLQDLKAGKPWITRLPFPVHCVSKTIVRDQWRGTVFSSTYSYHHGYFDGAEREFRGFGRVEQLDVENYGVFADGNSNSPWITSDKTLYQPPIKSITWYHTGAAIDRQRILTQFTKEYFPARFPNQQGFKENTLAEPELPADLSAQEWREALRACKGMVLRQESYELDTDAIHEKPAREVPLRLYSAATHNCKIKRIQKQSGNKHAVFFVTESEAISYQYELDLRAAQLEPDPRIAHSMNLRHDEYGNPQQSLAIAYGRVASGKNNHLPRAGLIDQVQSELHIAYSEMHYTDDAIRSESNNGPIKHYRLRAPCEALSYELKGVKKPTSQFYYTLADIRKLDLSESYGHEVGAIAPAVSVEFKKYHEHADGLIPQKRLIEHARSLYFNDEDGVSQPISKKPFGELGPRGLKYEDYKLALTNDLLDAVFQRRDANGNAIDNLLNWPLDANSNIQARSMLNDPAKSGYVPGTAIAPTLANQYWVRSGIAGFSNNANTHFYLPERYTDPFGNITEIEFDPRDLFVTSSKDAVGNTSQLIKFNYRVLAPSEMQDSNGNRNEVVFDTLGMPVAAAVKGKQINGVWEGDDLSGFSFALRNPSRVSTQQFCTANTLNTQQAITWLHRASTRFVYHFGEVITLGNITFAARPAGACAIQREQHQATLDANTLLEHKIQVALECSDGGGNVLMKKAQAEPEQTGGPLRWILNGLTILNNKGKPVKQYEPAFSNVFGCEMPQANGVTPILYYDAAGRVVRTEMPDGTYSRVEFSPWFARSFDANDNAYDPDPIRKNHSDWYKRRTEPTHPRFAEFNSTENQRAADLVKSHANTPSETHLDSLGREVIAITHNRKNSVDEKNLTFTKLDAEGKPLWIRDALGHLVMQYITPAKANNDPGEIYPRNAFPCYDIAGNLLHQHSMDAGDRWMLMDAAGKPLLAWDFNERQDSNNQLIEEKRLYSTDYDALHRPVAAWLRASGNNIITRQMLERFEYQDANVNDDKNLNGQLVKHYDSSGRIEMQGRDFKGNVLQIQRRLNNTPTQTLIDWQTNPDAKLEAEIETFSQITEYDALNRMVKLFNWHRVNKLVAVYLPSYNQRGVLASEKLVVGANKDNSPEGFNGGTTTRAIADIAYDAKGQRQYLKLGKGTITHYDYDKETFRLRQLRTTRPAYDPAFPNYRSNLNDARVLQQLHYCYDPVGNISEIFDEAYKPAFFANAIVEPKNQYEYDALYRLTKATGREDAAANTAPTQIETASHESSFPIQAAGALRMYTQIYDYDAVGNIKSMQHVAGAGSWTRRYAYAFDDPQQAASNRLWRTWQGSNDYATANQLSRVTYEYDSHGSMLNLANASDDYRMQWDHRDMIATINLGNGFSHYQYDAGKQRTRKWIDRTEQITGGNTQNIKEERIYLGGLELYRRTLNGALVEEIETLHLFDGEQRLLMIDQVIITDNAKLSVGVLYRYTLSNHLGSSCIELDHNADIISYEEYHPYGTSAYRAGRNSAEVKLKRYRYTGMERDEESGLSYHTARYYLPWLGRWGSADPKYLADGTNFFNYASCAPIGFTDRDGTQSVATKYNDLPPWMQQKLVNSGEVSLMPGKWKESPNVRKTYWEDIVLNVMTLGIWLKGFDTAESVEKNITDVNKSIALDGTGVVAKSLVVAGMTAGDITGTRKIVEGLRLRDSLETQSFTADEGFDMVTSGSAQLMTEVVLPAAIDKLSAGTKGLDINKQLKTTTSKTPRASTASRATAAYEGGAINVPEGKPFFQSHNTAPDARKALGIPSSVTKIEGFSGFQSAHMIPQTVGERLKKFGYSPGKALTANLPESVHFAFDREWIAVWDEMLNSGKTIRARDIQNMLDNAIEKAVILPTDAMSSVSVATPAFSSQAKAAFKSRVAQEFKDLGIKPDQVIVRAKKK